MLSHQLPGKFLFKITIVLKMKKKREGPEEALFRLQQYVFV